MSASQHEAIGQQHFLMRELLLACAVCISSCRNRRTCSDGIVIARHGGAEHAGQGGEVGLIRPQRHGGVGRNRAHKSRGRLAALALHTNERQQATRVSVIAAD